MNRAAQAPGQGVTRRDDQKIQNERERERYVHMHDDTEGTSVLSRIPQATFLDGVARGWA
jgi:hypothetical protein